MILAGDIGGTKTRLAVFEPSRLRDPVAVATYASRDHASLDEALRAFVATHPLPIDAACFGVAGPVKNGRCETTNLPWIVDARPLATSLGVRTVWLINDLEATAYGIAVLADGDCVVLNAGDPTATGNAAVIAAGTGLGEAGLYWDGRRHHPFPSEGGHASFAPRDDLEIELLRWLRREFDPVSWERVLSGPGLVNLYRFLRDTGRGEEPDWLRAAIAGGDGAEVISQAALQHRSPLCEAALDRFVALYGSEAANLALKVMATGGVYVGGGIAPKNVDKLRDGTFRRAFTAKGRMQPVLAAMPVRVILASDTGLWGAARCAALRAGNVSGP
jgi:glucokinase